MSLKFILIVLIFLTTLSYRVEAKETNTCYKENIDLGNQLHDSSEFLKSIAFYTNAYDCAKSRGEKIASLASLSAAEFNLGNKASSRVHLINLLTISPKNKWAREFAKKNGINFSKATDPVLSSSQNKKPISNVYLEQSRELKLLGLPQSVFIKGEITKQTVMQFVNTITKNDVTSATVYLDSPGGDLLAGIAIGKLIRKWGFSTGVMPRNLPEGMDNGICYSACVLIYSGGVYRSLSPKSKIGVHRFSRDTTTKSDLDLAQVLSSRIIKYLVEMGIDVGLFERMSNTGKNRIDVISLQDALRLKLVNNGKLQQSWSIESLEGKGVLYLKGVQQTWRGVGKLLFTCDSKDLIYATAMYSKGSLIPSGKYLLKTDKTEHDISGQILSNQSFYIVVFKPTLEQYEAIAQASTIGFSILAMNPDLFYGFDLDITQRKTLIGDYMKRCIRLMRK